MSDETWVPAPGFEGYYEVSDLGRVRTVERRVRAGRGLRRVPPVIRTPTPGEYGRLNVSLSVDGVVSNVGVHQLVLRAFHGPPPSEGMVCCHGDGDASNNLPANLRWGTYQDNHDDMRRHGTHHCTAKTNCKRGHRLGEPNITDEARRAGHRTCLACARGRARVSSAARAGVQLDMQAESDLCYEMIMQGIPIGTHRRPAWSLSQEPAHAASPAPVPPG